MQIARLSKRVNQTKTRMLTPAVFLLAAASYSQELAFNGRDLYAHGFESNAVIEVYGSSDFKTWTPRFELAADERRRITAPEFFRARQKPKPAQIVIESPSVSTGRIYQVFGKATDLLVNVGGLTSTDQEMGLTNGRPGVIFSKWEFAPQMLDLGTNVLTIDFLDANNNHIDTNFTVVCYPGPAITVEHPANGALVVGDTTTLIGRVDNFTGTVQIEQQTVSVQEDGHFYFVGFPVQETNVVSMRSGTNVVTVSFGKSHTSFNGNLSKRTASGTTNPSNRLNIGGRIVIPSADGSWKLDLPLPPVNGMLPFSIQSTNGESASGVITTQNDQTGYYVTSHAVTYDYRFWRTNDPKDHTFRYSMKMSSLGDVDGSFFKQNYPNVTACPGICEATYSGANLLLWLDSEEGPCDYIETMRYKWRFGLVDYSDETSGKWYAHDTLSIQEVSSCGMHIGGNSGRTFRIALQVIVALSSRDGSAGDEETNRVLVPSNKISHIGGFPVDSSGTVYFRVTEGRNYNITPRMAPVNQGWYTYGFDWNEVPTSTL